jgi:beta-glucosidase
MALQDAGGWLNRRTCDWFAEYAELMYRTLGDRVTYWTTHNEPNAFSLLGYLIGKHAPGVADYSTYLQVNHHLLLSHGKAVQAGRALLPHAKFGIVPAIGQDYTVADDPELVKQLWDRGIGQFLDPIFLGKYPEISESNEHFSPIILDGYMQQISVPIDFLGVNHYFSNWFMKNDQGNIKMVKQDHPVNDRGWIVYPDGIRDMLLNVKKHYGDFPIFIMENGASYPDHIDSDGAVHDQDRLNYYKGYIRSLHDAIERGVNVRGYFAWSLMDNFEWEEGYSSRFGIVYVYFATQKRIVKDSGKFYSKVIRDHGLEGK